MAKHWWKILCIVLLTYSIIGGFLFHIPTIPKLNESARNLYYHVPMWYVMIVSFLTSCIFSIKYLRKNNVLDDIKAREFVHVGIFFGCLGMLTGMEWASIAWGAPWSNDPKQVGAGLCLMIYFAYIVLRNSVKDMDKQARLAAVYNIFAFALVIPLLYIIPKKFESLHPASGQDGPLEALYTQAAQFRKVFYPAMIGWVLLGVWVFNIRFRIKKNQLQEHLK